MGTASFTLDPRTARRLATIAPAARLRLGPKTAGELRAYFCDLESWHGMRSNFGAMIDRLADAMPREDRQRRDRLEALRKLARRSPDGARDLAEFLASTVAVGRGGSSRKTIGGALEVFVQGTEYTADAETPWAERWATDPQIRGALNASGMRRCYLALAKLMETAEGARASRVLYRIYGPRPAGIGDVRDKGSLAYLAGIGGVDRRVASELVALFEYTPTAEALADARTVLERELHARRAAGRCERDDGQWYDLAVTYYRMRDRTTIEPRTAMLDRLRELDARIQNPEATKEAREAAKEKRALLLRQIEREAEKLLIRACSLYRAARFPDGSDR